MLKQFWNDPVWSKVLAAGIVAILGLAGTYLFNLWHYISDFFELIGNILTYLWKLKGETTAVVNWILFAIVLLALPTVFRLLVIPISLLQKKPTEDRPSLNDYTSDIFFNVKWRWRYDGQEMVDLGSFCPNCDFQVFPQRASSYAAIDRLLYFCDHCSSNLNTFDESLIQIESKIIRLAQLKMRNGEWQTTVQKKSTNISKAI